MTGRSDILFVPDRPFCTLAIELFRQFRPDSEIEKVARDGRPKAHFERFRDRRLGLVVSFLFPFRVPKYILECADLAVNFHPGSADYPGYGCFNFALYEGAAEYGGVCHEMYESFDAGPIFAEQRFPILQTHTVETLQFRTWVVLLNMLHDFLCDYERKGSFSEVATWSRKPFRKRDLDDITTISPGMPEEEVSRRRRATDYPGFSRSGRTDGRQQKVAQKSALDVPLVDRLWMQATKN